jgi:hypothetical protein
MGMRWRMVRWRVAIVMLLFTLGHGVTSYSYARLVPSSITSSLTATRTVVKWITGLGMYSIADITFSSAGGAHRSRIANDSTA